MIPTRRSMRRTAFIALMLLLPAGPASAQDYAAPKPRRQFVTISIDWLNTEPLHFASHPLEDLVGREVASAQGEEYDYRTRDEAIAHRRPGVSKAEPGDERRRSTRSA